MTALNRVLFNVLCSDLAESVRFYRDLLDLDTFYENDWYVVLTPRGEPAIQIALIDQDSQFTPRHAWGMHEGTYLTLVVENVYATMERAKALGAEIVADPVALDYGQTRGLIQDPNGMVLDISTPTERLAGHDEPELETIEPDSERHEERHWDVAAPTRH